MTPLATAAVALAAFAAAAAGAGAVRAWATRRRLLDVPGARSSHTVPTPRGGGLAIVAVTLLGVAAVAAAGVVATGPVLAWAVGGSVLVAAVSFIDDLRTLPAGLRLVAHGAAALPLAVCCGRLAAFLMCGGSLAIPGWAGSLLVLVWIVGLTNATNFMDGIDGIAGGQAVVAGVGWAALAPDPAARVIGLLLAAASAGFLVHNWPPAKLFMGDVGSAFLGYWFAALPLLAAPGDGRWLVVGGLMVWPFLFDTSITLLRRIRRRENVFAAHRSHLYQRLVITGWRHADASLLYAALAALGLGAAAAWRAGSVPGGVVVGVIAAAAAALWTLVAWRERQVSTAASAGDGEAGQGRQPPRR